MLEFGLLGNGPLHNRGCEAIVRSSVDVLSKTFGELRFLLASFTDTAEVDAPCCCWSIPLSDERPRWSRAWWKRQFNRVTRRPDDVASFLTPLRPHLERMSACFSIGGDGYSIDYGHFIVDRLVAMDELVKAAGIPLIILGASIGPFGHEPDFERRIRKHFDKVDLIVVREPDSYEYLKALGVERNVELAPDPAFVLPSEPFALPDRAQSMIDAGCIGINLSPLLAKHRTGGDLQRWVTLAGQVLHTIAERTDRPLVLIPHVFSRDRSILADDWVFLNEVLAKGASSLLERVWLPPWGLTCTNLKWLISQTVAFIGARTHATIAALSTATPCISIAYSRKAAGLNRYLFRNTEWMIPAQEVTPDICSTRLLALLDNRDTVRLNLQSQMPQIAQRVYSLGPMISEILTNRPSPNDPR